MLADHEAGLHTVLRPSARCDRCATRVSQFRGRHEFLSNFFVEPDGTDVEHEYQADKPPPGLVIEVPVEDADGNPVRGADGGPLKRSVVAVEWIMEAGTPGIAKRRGRSRLFPLRSRFDAEKVDVMRRLVRRKFTDHPALARRLLATGDAELVEGTWWNDRFWGVDMRSGLGENKLGQLLMEIRDDLRGARPPLLQDHLARLMLEEDE